MGLPRNIPPLNMMDDSAMPFAMFARLTRFGTIAMRDGIARAKAIPAIAVRTMRLQTSI